MEVAFTVSNVLQCLQLHGFIRVFPEMGLRKQTTDTDWIIMEIDHHVYGKQ